MGRHNHQLTTTQRGLGWAHQRLRQRLLPTAYGTPCPYCLEPMLQGQQLDLDHAVPRALGGQAGQGRMAHRSCNRRAGATLGNVMRANRFTGKRNSSIRRRHL